MEILRSDINSFMANEMTSRGKDLFNKTFVERQCFESGAEAVRMYLKV